MITLWPESYYIRVWLGEIWTRLDNYAFFLRESCTRTEEAKYIMDILFDANDLMTNDNEFQFDKNFLGTGKHGM